MDCCQQCWLHCCPRDVQIDYCIPVYPVHAKPSLIHREEPYALKCQQYAICPTTCASLQHQISDKCKSTMYCGPLHRCGCLHSRWCQAPQQSPLGPSKLRLTMIAAILISSYSAYTEYTSLTHHCQATRNAVHCHGGRRYHRLGLIDGWFQTTIKDTILYTASSAYPELTTVCMVHAPCACTDGVAVAIDKIVRIFQ